MRRSVFHSEDPDIPDFSVDVTVCVTVMYDSPPRLARRVIGRPIFLFRTLIQFYKLNQLPYKVTADGGPV